MLGLLFIDWILACSCFDIDLKIDSIPGRTFPTYDPRTGDVLARVAEGDAEDIDRAVAAARKAFDEGPWPKMTPYVRLKKS